MRGMQTKEGLLILDDHKLPWHYEHIQAWEAGERIAPISIDMALTRACQASCRGCYAMVQEPLERANITTDHAYRFLDDCAEMGVKAVSLVSDGESTLSPAYVPFIERAAEMGIDVGNATNGWIFTPEMMERILPKLKWVRFTILAGTPDDFTQMMYHDPNANHVFWRAAFNISEAVRIKRKRKLGVTLGIQTFIMPDDKSKISAFAKFGLDLGVDYVVIKHTSDDEAGRLGVDYGRYHEIYDALRQAENMSTDDTKVIVKWSKIRDGNSFSYKRFYGPPFLLQISGSGLVAPSGMFFNARHSKFHLGNFTEERFIDIWRSDRYWEVMSYLASPYFDAQRMLGTLPIQHYASVALDRHVKGIERIQPAGDPKPLHVNFV